MIAAKTLLQGTKPVSTGVQTEKLVKSGGYRQMVKDFESVEMDHVSKFKLPRGVSKFHEM